MSAASMRWKRKGSSCLASLGLLLITGAFFYPLVWMSFSSLKTSREILNEPWSLPVKSQWGNFSKAWQQGSLGLYVGNSLWITATSTLLVLATGSATGYACARLRFRGKACVQGLFLAGLVLPIQAAAIPLCYLLSRIGLWNTRSALVLSYAAWGLPLAVFIFAGFFSQIPKELDEAGRIDGCGEMSLYWRIFLPLCKPAVGTVALFTCLGAWNELLMALLFIQDNELKPLPAGLLAFFGYRQAQFSLLFAGLTLVTIPMFVVYFALQRSLMKGLAGGLGELR